MLPIKTISSGAELAYSLGRQKLHQAGQRDDLHLDRKLKLLVGPNSKLGDLVDSVVWHWTAAISTLPPTSSHVFSTVSQATLLHRFEQ